VQQVRYLTSTEQASNSLMFSHFLFTEGGISLSAAIFIRAFCSNPTASRMRIEFLVGRFRESTDLQVRLAAALGGSS